MTRQRKYKWEIVTKIEKKERGIIVMLDSLEEDTQSKTSASKLKATQISSEDSLKPLLEKLDLVFKSRKNNDAYEAYSKFISFRRDEEMSMLDYLLEYKHLYHQVTEHDMTLPETVLVFNLLGGANLKEDERKLALALGNDLSLKTMKFILKRIFGKLAGGVTSDHETRSMTINSTSLAVNSTSFSVKQKESFFTESVNSPGNYEYVCRCTICQSIMHSADICQHAPQSKLVVEKLEEKECVEDNIIVLHLAEDHDKYKILVDEANSAIMNTLFKETVAGEQWFANYTNKLSPLHQKGVEIYPYSAVFKFVNGRKIEATKTAVFPVKIGRTICKLEAVIVDENIPLVLGKTSLKKANTIIDIQHDKAKMFDQEVLLQVSKCGDYYVNIFPEEDEYVDMAHEGRLMLDGDQSPFIQKEKMIQLHNQFGHATAENLKRIARNAGIMNSSLNSIIDNVVDECYTCAIVGLSESDDFNQRIFVGFHEIESNVWFMQIVDEYTRFSNAAIIRSKRATVRTFLKCWLSLFGAPREIFSDNRSEFTGEDFFEMCKSFGVKMSKTPPSSPWSNGVSERHNKTLTSILLEIKDDNKCGWDAALVWAISAKNAIINHSGQSPAQLVFGRIGKRPNSFLNKFPGLSTSSEPTKSEIKIPTPLQSIRRPRDVGKLKEKSVRERKKETKKSFNHNKSEKSVYYQREVTQHWHGSSRVLVPVLLLRKGEEYVKAHVCRVQSFENQDGDKSIDSGTESEILNEEGIEISYCNESSQESDVFEEVEEGS